MIISGDFNTTFISFDRYYTLHRKDEAYTELMTSYQLCDIWRNRYPSSSNYSWKRIIENELKMSRIDYFLVSRNCMKFVNNVYYKETTYSDHSFVYMNIKFDNVERPGVWVLNNLVLDETEYITRISELIYQEKQ